MVEIKIKIDGPDFFKALDEKLDEVADDVFANSQDNIVEKKIIDEGTLLKSGGIERSFLEKTVRYSALYSDVIEFGRDPGSYTPIAPLIAWVKRKGLAKDDKEAKSIAYAISRDIKKKGLIPRPFMSPAIQTTLQKLKSK